jgi:DNA-binding response OmpR family regulator
MLCATLFISLDYMSGKLILLVEDNKEVQNLNRRMLEDEGFTVATAMTLADARAFVEREKPNAIILDIGMPDGDGRNFLREIRAGNSAAAKVPVLILTGYGKNADVVAGFESGCNDYLAKPYTFSVLFMRAKELLSRTERLPDVLQKGPLRLDVVSGLASLGGKDLRLTQKEFSLLLLFAQNEGKTVSAEYLYEKVWKQPLAWDKNAVQTAISKLRKKIEDAGYGITIIRGQGYVFEEN